MKEGQTLSSEQKFSKLSRGFARVTSLSELQLSCLKIHYCNVSLQSSWGPGWNKQGYRPCAKMQTLGPLRPPSVPSRVRPVECVPWWGCISTFLSTDRVPGHLLATQHSEVPRKSPFPQEVHRLKPETASQGCILWSSVNTYSTDTQKYIMRSPSRSNEFFLDWWEKASWRR